MLPGSHLCKSPPLLDKAFASPDSAVLTHSRLSRIACREGKASCFRLHSLPRRCAGKDCLVCGFTHSHSGDSHEGLAQLEIPHGTARCLFCSQSVFQLLLRLNPASLTPNRYSQVPSRKHPPAYTSVCKNLFPREPSLRQRYSRQKTL